MPPIEPNDEERTEALPEDNQMPFQPADPAIDPSAPADDGPVDRELDSTHPATDSRLDEQELYDEGVSGAAEVEDPQTPNSAI